MSVRPKTTISFRAEAAMAESETQLEDEEEYDSEKGAQTRQLYYVDGAAVSGI